MARLYADVVATFVLDDADADEIPAIEALGVRAVATDILMPNRLRRQRLAGEVLQAVGVPMTAAAVIPVKPIDRALGRLGSVLSPGERRDLQSAMLLDLLDALPGQRGRGRDVRRDRRCGRCGAQPRGRRPRTLGPRPTAGDESGGRDRPGGGRGPADRRGPDPHCRPAARRSQDLDAIIAALRPGRGAVLVPSRDGTGTNALALAPPFGIATRLGANSRALHEYALQNAGIAYRRLEMPSLALDVDTPADLLALARCDDDGRAALCCAAWGMADRLGAGVVR